MQTQSASLSGQAAHDQTLSQGSRPRFRSYARMTDAEIVVWCQRGDNEALETLISRFKRPIYALAYRLTSNHEDAADVAAAATLRVCQNIDKCRTAVTLPAWVNRIVVNTFYDMCRTAKKYHAISLDALTQNTDSSSLPCLSSDAKSPLVIMMRKEQQDILHRVLARMPKMHADIISQFYLEERSYEEIAEISHVPVGTVKSRLNRARAALQRKLQAYNTAFVA